MTGKSFIFWLVMIAALTTAGGCSSTRLPAPAPLPAVCPTLPPIVVPARPDFIVAQVQAGVTVDEIHRAAATSFAQCVAHIDVLEVMLGGLK